MAAAKLGLVGPQDINIMWFQELQRDIRNATKGRKEDKKVKGKEKDNKSDSKALTAQTREKKEDPVKTGFIKFARFAGVDISIPQDAKFLEYIRDNKHPGVTELRNFVRDNFIATKDEDDVKEGKTLIKPSEYAGLYEKWGLTESEAKAARTYFPYMGKTYEMSSKDFWSY